MRKQYPYLQDSYIYQTDVEREKRTLLSEIDSFVNQRQYVKITLLDWNEEPIKAIEGEISSGSISKNGDSPIRRTAQLTCAVDARSYSVDDGKADFAINKKVFIEIGVKNETPHYPNYPIFWFPEGVFFIGSFAINAGANSSTTITLSLKDKMAMLNGDIGGTLPSTVIFDSMDTQLPNGKYIEKKVLIYNIIKELVNHYGGEDLNRIIIEGVPLRIRRIMQWNGDTPLWRVNISEVAQDNTQCYQFTTIDPHDDSIPKYEKGDDVGYIMDDFVITDELTGAPGESVTSILDKIKNILGNYEYFYDIFGTFHFREIKNYYVTTQARTLLDEMSENDYLVETNNSRSIYTFDDEKLLTSINVTPQYENIKNDYIIEGQTSIVDSDITIPIRYHLAIDKKPEILGKDRRTGVRKKINNNNEIADKQDEMKQLSAIRAVDTRKLETLLFNIRNAKQYIIDKQDLIDVKDKELLKQLQDYFNTTFTYTELNKVISKENSNIHLLSEAWLELYNPFFTISLTNIINHYEFSISVDKDDKLLLQELYFQPNDFITQYFDILLSEDDGYLILTSNKNDIIIDNNDKLANFLTSIEDNLISTLERRQLNLKNTLVNKKNQYDVSKQYIQSIVGTNIDTNDIEKIIYNYDNNNFNVNDTLYKSTIEAMQNLNSQIEQLNTELKILNIEIEQRKESFKNYKNNLLLLYSFIKILQEQIEDKLIELDGKPFTRNMPLGQECNHEYLLQFDNDNIQWFSYNIEKIDDFQKQDNKYSFISNNINLTINLNSNDYYPFYKNSLFGDFYEEFIKYHNLIDDDNSIIEQINQLEQQIQVLEELNFQIKDDTNKHLNQKFYGIYPTENVDKSNIQEMILYQHPRDNYIKAAYITEVLELPNVGNFNLIYKQDNKYWYWDGEMYQTPKVLEIYDNSMAPSQYYAYDWRTKLYLDGLKATINGTDQGYYYAELSAFWPQIYNLQTQKFFVEEKAKNIDYKTLAIAGTYYLDFLDENNTSFGEWSVNNIGRRSDVIVKEEINCLFQPEIPNVILLPTNNIDLNSIGKNMANETYRYGSSLESSLTLEELREEANKNYYPWSQVSAEIYNNLLTGGYRNGAFDQIKYELYLHTRYQKSISLTSIPVFYLEPNNRISIADTTTNTYGDFVIQSINLTLGPGANMSITCNEAAERF